MDYTSIRFPHLGITLGHVGRSISIGGFEIMFYGMIIACGFLMGLWIAQQEAKRTGQDPELYLDYLLWLVIPAIAGARAYYVIFSWDQYKGNLMEILNLRHGGLGIVGGVMAGIVVLLIFARVRKQKPLLMLDTLSMGLLIGQIMGRWGNFFNREAFGGFTDNLFAMQIPVEYFSEHYRLPEIANTGLLEHLVNVNTDAGMMSCIQVHPTFLYESAWNLALLLFLLYYRKRKAFDGDMFCIYLMGYGLGRFLIEGLRVDQLQIGSTGIAATQIVCICIFFGGLITELVMRRRKAVRKAQS